ncbi:hypothetical protein PT974_05241 [Cladobotryum mycophilum]|uniref:Uncharacterized protein n=1 Tax=Cladobotryum mycophilum TaxID=491253 RepID=A0ABR0SI79_9HYPO
MLGLHHEPPSRDVSDPQSIKARTQPFFRIPVGPDTAFTDGHIAQQSIDKLLLFDAHPNIFICLSHDETLFHFLPLYNKDPSSDINDWKTRGYKENSRWYFLNELPKDGEPGRGPLVVGLKRDGKTIAWAEEKGFYELE